MRIQNKQTLSVRYGFVTFLRSHVFRRFLKLLYHQLAWTYDTVASTVSANEWNAWVLTTLPFIVGQRVLEIGFGPGHLQKACKQKNINIVGLDASFQMCHQTQKRLNNAGYQPELVNGYAQWIPFNYKSFDQVISTFPSEFILQSQTMAELHRILDKDGSVVIVPLAWVTGHKLFHRIIGWINLVAGEAPVWDENYIEMFRSPLFEPQWQMIDLPTSKVLLVRLRKIT